MDFSKITIGCSKINLIMTESKDVLSEKQLNKIEYLQLRPRLTEKQQSDLEKLIYRRDNDTGFYISETCKSYLLSLYSIAKYGTRYKLQGGTGVSQMVKGIVTENDAIKLLSSLDGTKYYKNKKVLRNNFITGSIDIMDAETILKSTKIVDVKSSYEIHTFLNKLDKPLSKNCWWQMQGYLALTRKEFGEVSYCLVDFPSDLISEQRQIVLSKMCPDMIETKDFLERWTKIQASMLFSDIPFKERVISHKVERDDNAIDKIYERVEQCREWLSKFKSTHESIISKKYFNE